MARCFVALFPESIKTMLFLAGLLTYPSLNAFPSGLRTVACSIFKEFGVELTAAGLSGICTRFPF